MAKPKTPPAGGEPPVIPPTPGAVLTPSVHGAGPVAEPGSEPPAPRAGPPDRDADGRPGGSDPLHPCAVLLAPHAGLAGGLIVCGPRAAIAALVDASAARMATPTDLAIAGGIAHPLPTET